MLVDREWIDKHKHDHTREEIDNLSITVVVDSRIEEIRNRRKAGSVKSFMEKNRQLSFLSNFS
jgi:hypothetical protein